MNKSSGGFTIVEMMVTLFVGALLIGVFYQLFVSIVQYGSDSRSDSAASNVASQILKKYTTTLSVSGSTNCSDSSEVLPVGERSGSSSFLGAYTKSLKSTCRYPVSSPTITLLTATVTYGNGTKSISQAIYVN